jgi:SAM-dependent methyltransferase
MLSNLLFKLSKKNSRKNLYEFLRAELSKLSDGSVLLNIGSGGEIGSLIEEICARKDFQKTSLDISPDRKPDIVGDVCQMTFKSSFDIIVMAEVLEHVLLPKTACQKLYEALRPGGRVILTTPFIFPLHDRPYDYWRFTRYGLQYLLSEAGFSEISIRERNSWGEAVAVLLWRVVNTPGYPRLAKYSIGFTALLLSPIGRFVSRIWPHDFLTTAYHVSAVKRVY